MAWSVDRLNRSVTDLCNFLTEIHALKIDLYLHSQELDTSTPMGKAMFQIAGVFAELERSILKERIMAGIARARDKGTKSGKPIRMHHLEQRFTDSIGGNRSGESPGQTIIAPIGQLWCRPFDE
jgi:DNA invertase Pin-like site-specific DNA recombinase